VLHQLHLSNVGPSSELQLELAPRLNLLTGDNGLGKSFLLDVAWYALTRRWPQEVNPALTSGALALPRSRSENATIAFMVDGENIVCQPYACPFDPEDEQWVGPAGRPVNPGVILYAMADGAFAVWDPARNARVRKADSSTDTSERTKHFCVHRPAGMEGAGESSGGHEHGV
jgi:hypothetical protein